MTVTVLEPVIVEGVDLDETPQCDNCQAAPATARLRLWCGHAWLNCAPCRAGCERHIALGILIGGVVTCTHCGAKVKPRKVSDVIVRVTPL